MDGNLLETLNADFFGAFNKPTAITAQRNNISQLPSDLFSQVKGKLKNIDLRSQRNKVLTCLPPLLLSQKNIKLRV